MSTTEQAVAESKLEPKSIPLVLGTLAVAAILSAVANSFQQYGSLAAFSRSRLATDLIVGAIGVVVLLPAINVGIASIWGRYRNPRSRRNIFFGWGVAITLLQLVALLNIATRVSQNPADTYEGSQAHQASAATSHPASPASTHAEAKTIDPELVIRNEGFESERVGDDGKTIFYVLGKTESAERITQLENQVAALPKDQVVFQVCDLMRGGAKSKLIQQSGDPYDIAVADYGSDGSTIVCVLKFMLHDNVGTQISYTKQTSDGVYQVFIKS